MNVNKVFLGGRLTQEVEYKDLPSGTGVATLNVATNRFYKDKNGENREETQFHRVVVWGKLAEVCKNYLAKGREVFIEGRITYRSWQGVDGSKRVSTEIVAESGQFESKTTSGGSYEGKPKASSSGETEEVVTLEDFEPTGGAEFEIPY